MKKCESPKSQRPEGHPTRIMDISLALTAETAPWPGDPGLEIRDVATLAAGDPSLVRAMSLGLHMGTHLDAPAHVFPDGLTVDCLPLDLFHGPALVVDLSCPDHEPGLALKNKNQVRHEINKENTEIEGICVEELEAAGIPAGCPRLLLKTRPENSRDPAVFSRNYRHLTPEAARWCLDRGVHLLGMDTPSPDPVQSTDLPAHHILLGAGTPLLENLDLTGVAAGTYVLVCLPLRLQGLEASPVRAVLLAG